MESGFRKFWKRKKSKGATDLQPQSETGQRSQSRPSFSTLGDTRPSISLLRQYNRRDSHDRAESPRDYVSVTSGEFPRPKSRSRIRPILIGISRPTNSTSRPGTAGSLYNAVQQAADAVHERRSQDLRRNAVLKQAHERTGSNRSVDIFTVASSLPSRTSRFNEEIALRNLDTVRTAGLTPDGEHDYVPTSRYQEEVAVRNSSDIPSTRSSIEQSRAALNSDRAASLTSRDGRSTASPTPNASVPHRFFHEASSPPYNVGAEGQTHHARQYSQQARDKIKALPPILQNDVEEDDDPRRLRKIQTSHAIVKAQDRPSSRGMGQSPKVGHEISGIIHHNNQTPSYHTRQSLDSSRPNTADGIGIPLSASSTFSGLEPPARHVGRLIVPNSAAVPYTHERQDSLDMSSKSNSLFSASGARRTSGSRTIMDLTNEDMYSETSSMYGYSQYSPVLEHANSGSVQRSYPVHASPYAKVLSKDTLPINNGIARSPALIQPEYTHLSEGHVATISDVENSPTTRDDSPSQIAFSPINTLASWSPRNSVFYQQVTEEPTPKVMAPCRPVEEVSSIVDPVSLAVESPAVSLLQPRTGTGERSRLVATTPGHGEQAISVPRDTAKTYLSTRTGSKLMNAGSSSAQSQGEPERPEKGSLASPTSSKKRNANATLAQTHQQVLEPTGASRPAKHVDPSLSPGVLTRDFALSPRKSTSSPKKLHQQSLHLVTSEPPYKDVTIIDKANPRKTDSKHQENKEQPPRKASKSRAKSSATQAKASSSGFDEEAFARKQAEAKAALLRLQQSLQEDFTTMPLPKPAKKTVRRPEPDSTMQLPVPTSTINTKRPSTSDSSSGRGDVRAPPTSFRGVVAGPERSSSMSSARSRSGGRASGKAVPASLKNVAAASSPINPALLPPSLQLILQTSTKPPRSPGDISLSSFPLPSSRPSSEHEPIASPVGSVRPAHVRRGSSKSLASMASQFSIPVHMIPDRSSSVRDTLTEEED